MYPYRLPLKFIGLWVLNLAVLLTIGIGLGLNDWIYSVLPRFTMMDLTYVYLFLAAALALLEQELWDRLKGN